MAARNAGPLLLQDFAQPFFFSRSYLTHDRQSERGAIRNPGNSWKCSPGRMPAILKMSAVFFNAFL